MVLILEARHFTNVALDRPHVSRGDGGHLVINPELAVEDRTQLSREQAVELLKLTMVVGEAMSTVLTRKDIDIGRINYQDNGNWRSRVVRASVWARPRREAPAVRACLRVSADEGNLHDEDGRPRAAARGRYRPPGNGDRPPAGYRQVQGFLSGAGRRAGRLIIPLSRLSF